jgi:tRNA A22 N-methylase
VLGPESKMIFIAGMGGKEIQEIIQNILPQLSMADRLVISPHRNILELRKYLHSTELGLVDEICLKEDGQFYQILCLIKAPEFAKVPLYGAKIWDSEVGREYREHQIGTFSYHQDGQSQAYVSYLKALSH